MLITQEVQTICLQKNVKNRNLLTSQLNRIKNLAVRNRQVCADSITKINNTINLINELQMATLSAQSEEKDRLNVLMKEKAAFDAKLSTSTAMLHDVNKDLKRQLDRVKQLESEYTEAQKEATPRVGEIFFSAIVDIVKFAPQLLSNVMAHLPSAPSVVERMPSPKPTAGNKQTNEQVDELNVSFSLVLVMKN
ncbi:unnamed protein product [Anisakis simplex]|uniref:ATG16 domain-containing protein n=1 Tax=Anisakis simplex TaxID=6269 RepID=A0A0M3J867_ANISI|nr:unnamed protein product [Anisakis simplex]